MSPRSAVAYPEATNRGELPGSVKEPPEEVAYSWVWQDDPTVENGGNYELMTTAEKLAADALKRSAELHMVAKGVGRCAACDQLGMLPGGNGCIVPLRRDGLPRHVANVSGSP